MLQMIDEYMALVIIGIVLIIVALKSPFNPSVEKILIFGLGGLIGYLGRGVISTKQATRQEPKQGDT